VLGGELRFGTPQLVRANCPNSLEFDIGFSFSGFVNVSGTVRLMADIIAFPMNGIGRLCLRNFRLISVSIPAAPGLQGLAMGLVAQLLPAELCVNLPGGSL
jgi:hypothetical protein